MKESRILEATFDADGYPTDAFLSDIEKHSSTSVKGWRDFMSVIEGAWAYRDWGWHTEGIHEGDDAGRIRYKISTAGWSGNESLIAAMKNNKNFFWTQFWESHRRGGHYTFLI